MDKIADYTYERNYTDNLQQLIPPTCDDIEEWCNCILPEAVRQTEDRQMWRDYTDAIIGLNGLHELEA